MEKQILVADEAAALIRISRQRLYELCRTNSIPYILLGQRQYRFSKQKLEEWLEGGGSQRGVNSDDKE